MLVFPEKRARAETQFNLLLTGNGLGMGVQSAGTLIYITYLGLISVAKSI